MSDTDRATLTALLNQYGYTGVLRAIQDDIRQTAQSDATEADQTSWDALDDAVDTAALYAASLEG